MRSESNPWRIPPPDAQELGPVPERPQPQGLPRLLRLRIPVRTRSAPDPLAPRPRLPRLRLRQLLPRAPVQPVQAPGLPAGQHRLPVHQAPLSPPGSSPSTCWPKPRTGSRPWNRDANWASTTAPPGCSSTNCCRPCGNATWAASCAGPCRSATPTWARKKRGGQRGRGLGNKTPLATSVQVTDDAQQPVVLRPSLVAGLRMAALERWAREHLERGAGQLRDRGTGVGEHHAGKCEALDGRVLSCGPAEVAGALPGRIPILLQSPLRSGGPGRAAVARRRSDAAAAPPVAGRPALLRPAGPTLRQGKRAARPQRGAQERT